MNDNDSNGNNRARDDHAACVVVIFTCQNHAFAINVHAVRRIAWLPQLTPVEEMPAYVPGVINVQGAVAPIVDLNARFGHAAHACRLTDSIILFETRGRLAGVVADEVLDVVDAVPIAAPQRETGNAHLLAGELDVQGRTVMLLAHDEILPAEPAPSTAERAPFLPDATPEEIAVLRSRAEALMRESTAETTVLGGLAVIALDGEHFGVDLAAVREFSEIGDVVPVPCCPPHITGNMNLRGDIVTIVDLRGVLKLPPSESHAGKLIVSEHQGRWVGVPVQDVLSVIYADPARYRKLPASVETAERDYLLGEVPFEEKMLTVLDLKKILGRRELMVNEEV